jgi:hypothetical protein
VTVIAPFEVVAVTGATGDLSDLSAPMALKRLWGQIISTFRSLCGWLPAPRRVVDPSGQFRSTNRSLPNRSLPNRRPNQSAASLSPISMTILGTFADVGAALNPSLPACC